MIPCGCMGVECEMEEATCWSGQCHLCCTVSSGAIPCSRDDGPVACSVGGLTVYPKIGCFVKHGEVMNRD